MAPFAKFLNTMTNSTDSLNSSIPNQPLLAGLAKSFDPSVLEGYWQAFWEKNCLAQAGYRGLGKAKIDQPSFAIQLPPPNVTGTLHMGHAFNQTIMDSLTRYHRMKGFNTVWIPGTDHAGIATQIVVERQLKEKGQSRHDLGREDFVEKVWEWKEHSGNTITNQMKRMGDSVDWSREYFTMDEKLSQTVTQTFVQLYEQGLIYRGKRLVNWDPVLKTAVSDLEVEHIQTDGFMHYVCYPFVDGEQIIEGKSAIGMTIATTRPETMMADGALCVHPKDTRYQHLIGKYVELPLCNRTIPIVADEFVDKEFGSGCVKITGAHDFNDYACAIKHNIALITIFTQDARINANGPEKYRGMDRFEARKVYLTDLKEKGYLIEIKPHSMMLPICARTGQIVEPMLTDQWFVAMNKASSKDASSKSIAQKAIDAVHSGQVKFFPETWINTYNQWMNNIQDWCISRQLWWGHQIPAWYDEAGNIYVAHNEAEALRKSGGKPLKRDSDVLDTWYSSALVPFSTMGWPEKTQDYDLYLPSTVLITGYDIIFFWVARMIMMTTHFTGKIPFKHVYIHGLVRDAQGKKMSKSEGNVLDPVDLIDGIDLEKLIQKRTTGLRKPETAPQIMKATEKEFPNGIAAFGADALRFTFASLASLGRNVNFDSKRCEGYRNFCNKIWNASRFVLMNCEGYDCGVTYDSNDPAISYSLCDLWIISLLQTVEQQVAKGFEEYRLDNVANTLYDFIWNEYCDWYLEIAKVQIAHGNTLQQRTTRRTLVRVLEVILRLLHPIMPFITEDLWQKVAPLAGNNLLQGDNSVGIQSISVMPYPIAQTEKINESAIEHMARLKKIIDACRNLRSEMGIPPSTKIPLLVLASANDKDFLDQIESFLKALAKISDIKIFELEDIWQQEVRSAPIAVVSNVRLCLHVKIDIQAERTRLNKEIESLQKELDKANAKLNNQAFIEKAPASIIEQEKMRVESFGATLNKIKIQLQKLTG